MRGLKRKVIRIRAEDSPNVRLALAEIAAGLGPSGRVLIPGVKQHHEYADNRRYWDAHQQCVSLDADWYAGADVLMYPPEWLNRAERRARELAGVKRQAAAIGVDVGEGAAETCLVVVDQLGLVALQARRTPDTSEIPGWVLAFAAEHEVPPDRVFFDRGGGGHEHACLMRRQGYAVQTVAFGESLSAPVKPRGVVSPVGERRQLVEARYTYRNRRAAMYHGLRLLLDPAGPGFALPAGEVELRRQLAPVPLWYDEEGRIYLPPKQARPDDDRGEDKTTMVKLLGRSPDRADALVLAVHGLTAKVVKFRVRSMV